MSVSLYGSGQTVLQVVSATTTNSGGYVSTTSTSFVSTGFSVTITPQSTSSKIYLLCHGTFESNNSNNRLTIYRGGTNLGSSTGMTQTNAVNYWVSSCMSYLDSPATTSATTYTVYFNNSGGSGTSYFGGDGNQLCITAFEISGA